MGKYLNSYTAGYKLKVIEYALEHGKRAAGRKFDVDEKCVRRWCAQKEALRNTNSTKRAFRGEQCKFPDLEEDLLHYVTEVRNDGLALTTDMLRVKGLALATVLGWILSAWSSVSTDIVSRSFKVAGISNSLDGTEDDCLWGDGASQHTISSRTPSLRTRRVTTIEHVCRKKCRILQ